VLKSSKSIGELIYYYRLVKNYSQNDLANALNVTVSAVSSWERGVNKPGVDIALKLSDNMGISLDDFYKEKTKLSHDKKYTINDLVAFEKAYMKWQKIQYIEEHKQLQISLFIWGLSIHKELLQSALNIKVMSDQEMKGMIPIEIVDHDMPIMLLSPEFKLMPMFHPKGYLALITIPYDDFEDLTLEVQYQMEKVTFEIPMGLVKAVTLGIPFQPENPASTMDFMESKVFNHVLKYFATVDDFKTLQDYLVQNYKGIADHCKRLTDFMGINISLHPVI